MDLSLHVRSADRFVPPVCSADVSYMMQDVREGDFHHPGLLPVLMCEGPYRDARSQEYSTLPWAGSSGGTLRAMAWSLKTEGSSIGNLEGKNVVGVLWSCGFLNSGRVVSQKQNNTHDHRCEKARGNCGEDCSLQALKDSGGGGLPEEDLVDLLLHYSYSHNCIAPQLRPICTSV
ncbi:hypothetical protein Q9966_012616 [Columba livia]|nr:hypothetical protein Q9966_012616 [Columba livia]